MRTYKPKSIKTVDKVQPKQPAKPESTATQPKHPAESLPSIAVCVPCYVHISPKWFINFFRFIMSAMSKYRVHVLIQETQPTSVARNNLVDMAMEKGVDYILWVDSDNLIPNGTIDQMLQDFEKTGADLVSALYFSKDPPHYPVIRYFKSGGFFKYENPGLGQVFEIAGCGFGLCMVKADVFNKLTKPYFKFSDEVWGYRSMQMSEDLYFCRKMLRADMKLVCDAGIVSNHHGGTIGMDEYMNYTSLRQHLQEDREEALKDLQQFVNESEYEIDMRVMVGPGFLSDEWEANMPQKPTPDQLLEFYRNSESQIYQQVNYHFGENRKFDNEVRDNIVRLKERLTNEQKWPSKPRILDYGCGIGQNAIMLARAGFDVTLADVDGPALRFAEYRFKQHGLDYKVWRVDKEEYPKDGALDVRPQYDMIIAFDSLEHVHPDKLPEVMGKLRKLQHKHTEMAITNDFQPSPIHYQHFGITEAGQEALDAFINKKNI